MAGVAAEKNPVGGWLAGDGVLADAIAGKPGAYREVYQPLRKTNTNPMMINPIPSRLSIASLLPKIR